MRIMLRHIDQQYAQSINNKRRCLIVDAEIRQNDDIDRVYPHNRVHEWSDNRFAYAESLEERLPMYGYDTRIGRNPIAKTENECLAHLFNIAAIGATNSLLIADGRGRLPPLSWKYDQNYQPKPVNSSFGVVNFEVPHIGKFEEGQWAMKVEMRMSDENQIRRKQYR